MKKLFFTAIALLISINSFSQITFTSLRDAVASGDKEIIIRQLLDQGFTLVEREDLRQYGGSNTLVFAYGYEKQQEVAGIWVYIKVGNNRKEPGSVRITITSTDHSVYKYLQDKVGQYCKYQRTAESSSDTVYSPFSGTFYKVYYYMIDKNTFVEFEIGSKKGTNIIKVSYAEFLNPI